MTQCRGELPRLDWKVSPDGGPVAVLDAEGHDALICVSRLDCEAVPILVTMQEHAGPSSIGTGETVTEAIESAISALDTAHTAWTFAFDAVVPE